MSPAAISPAAAPPPGRAGNGPGHTSRTVGRATFALGIPSLAVLGGIPVLARSHAMLWGMPVLLDWIFAWMPGTSLCLLIAWLAFDRHEDASDDRHDGASRARPGERP